MLFEAPAIIAHRIQLPGMKICSIAQYIITKINTLAFS